MNQIDLQNEVEMQEEDGQSVPRIVILWDLLKVSPVQVKVSHTVAVAVRIDNDSILNGTEEISRKLMVF